MSAVIGDVAEHFGLDRTEITQRIFGDRCLFPFWRNGPGPDRDALVAMLRALSHADGARRRRT